MTAEARRAPKTSQVKALTPPKIRPAGLRQPPWHRPPPSRCRPLEIPAVRAALRRSFRRRRRQASNHRLDTAITPIADPALQPQSACFLFDESAIADALHEPR